MLTGTLFNTFTIVLGSVIGMKLGSRLEERIQQILFTVAGLSVMVIGLSMALKAEAVVAMLTCLMLGAVVGEYFDIEHQLERFADSLKNKFHTESSHFSDGFVTATLTFCVGSMAIVGAIEEGLNHNHDILMAKGIIDGICAVLFAASLGVGVVFSAVVVFLYQGAISLSAFFIADWLTESTVELLSGVGGIMIVGLGFRLLEIKQIRVANLLPALGFALLWPALKFLGL